MLRDAHDAPLTTLHFFANEPRLMSAGGDNALKQWLFDNADGSGRLLRFRAGHAAPPSCLHFYGNGTRLLSAGELQAQKLVFDTTRTVAIVHPARRCCLHVDGHMSCHQLRLINALLPVTGYDRALRLFSVIQDQQSRELSQRHTAKRAKRLHVREEDLKLPRVTGMAACQVLVRPIQEWNIESAFTREILSNLCDSASNRCRLVGRCSQMHAWAARILSLASSTTDRAPNRCGSGTGATSSPLMRATPLPTLGC